MNYEAYLRSKLWKHIRRNVLRRDKWRCLSCGARAEVVHHGSYDSATMRGEKLDALVSLCTKCHEGVSFDAFGIKRSMKEQAFWTRDLIAETNRRREERTHERRTRKRRLSMVEIRERSLEYAEGRMR